MGNSFLLAVPAQSFCVGTGALQPRLTSWSCSKADDTTALSSATVKVGDWLKACVRNELTGGLSTHRSDDGIQVILDGYITDVEGITTGINERVLCEFIVDLYQRHGAMFPRWLRGSFVGVLVDSKQDSVFVFNDRRGSRSLYLRVDEPGSILISSEVATAAAAYPHHRELNDIAVGEYLLRGAFYGNDTVFNGIEKIPQASVMVIKPRTVESKVYWMLEFNPRASTVFTEGEAVEECNHLLCQATKRLLNVVHKPVLFLSGGVDSRVVAGCLMAEGETDFDAATYGYSTDDGDDIDIARQLAIRYGWNHHVFQICPNKFANYFQDAVRLVDCRADVLDAPSLVEFWQSLGEEHDSFFIGDECFGWRGEVNSSLEALDAIGWWGLEKSERIAGWFHPQVRRKVRRGIRRKLRSLLQIVGQPNYTDVKDRLYYQERFGNLLNGQLGAKQHFMVSAQPLVDEDVMDFISQLPRSYRLNKALLRLVLASKYPALDKVALAQAKPLPSGTVVSPTEIWRERYVAEFVDNVVFQMASPELDELFDMALLRKTFLALVAEKALPTVQLGGLRELPGLWRFLPVHENRVHATTGLLRVLGLKLYLSWVKDLAEAST